MARALGKGLDAILGDVEAAYKKELSDDNFVEEIQISMIVPNPFQPRVEFDEDKLSELSQSIKEHGLIQPIVVIRKDNGYMLVAGERRLKATKMLNKDTIKAIVVTVENKKLRELALIENIQREDLSPIELANSYKELIKEHNITQEELAYMLKKSRVQITNTLRLLNLSDKTKKLINSGKLTQGHGKIIVGLDENDEKIVVDTIIGQNLTARETENLVKRIKNNKNKNIIDAEFNNKILELRKKIQKLGLNCNVLGKKCTINFKNLQEINLILKKLSKV